MGNLLPIIVCLPFGVLGLLLYHPGKGLTPLPLTLLVLFPIVGWLGMNLLGLTGNREMRSEVGRLLDRDRLGMKEERYFVGFARPSFHGALDPHEDVGFLIVHPESLEFFGSELRAALTKRDAIAVRFRPNVHTLVGLGRWISVEGRSGGKPVRLLVEPRERASLIGNRAFSVTLKKRLDDWLTKEPAPTSR